MSRYLQVTLGRLLPALLDPWAVILQYFEQASLHLPGMDCFGTTQYHDSPLLQDPAMSLQAALISSAACSLNKTYFHHSDS